MLKNQLLAALFSLICVISLSSTTFGCACCSERGTYNVWTGKPDAYHLGLIREIKFGKAAELYMTEAAFESIRGLAALQKESDAGTMGDLSLVDMFTNNTWQMTIKTAGGKSGTLTLPVPSKMTIFKADTHEKSEESGEITVYKEFQFKGTVASGSGIFRGGIVRPTTYSLVFQGRGNNCDNAEDFAHWRLDVLGSKASYAFFGKLKS